MIYSYETLINHWIEEKNCEKIYTIGLKLKDDSESFLLDDAEELLEKTAKLKDVMTFLALLFSYEIEDLDGVELTMDGDNNDYVELLKLYKESAIDTLQNKALSLIKQERRYTLI